MSSNQGVLPIIWKSLALVATAPLFVTISLVVPSSDRILLAQSSTTPSTFALPNSLPSGTTVKVNGSKSMSAIGAALKQRFEEKFSGTTVDLATQGTDEALQALLRGEIDLAAVGRTLTKEEKAQGLTEVPIDREKIAIIVGSDNPFQGNLTFEQFARIFRGEITDWSEVGGPASPINFIDRPNFSDTRQALSKYKAFQTAPFSTGTNAVQVAEDDTALIVQQLGKNGISYAIASQVLNQPNIRAIAMHGTLPSDPRYPYSQPRGYVYKGKPNPGVQAFLGFATSVPGQEAIRAAKQQEAAAVQEAVPTSPSPLLSPPPEVPTPTAPEADATPAPAIKPDTSRLWWLLVPLLGLPLLLWWGKRKAVVPPPVAAQRRESRMILTPRDCQDAYAYWDIAAEDLEKARGQGKGNLKVRLYDTTDIADVDRQLPHSVVQLDCNEQEQDLHIPIARDDRDYVAELGYLTDEGRWLRIARSPHVRVPACSPVTGEGLQGEGQGKGLQAATAVTGGTALAAGAATARSGTLKKIVNLIPEEESRIILVPRNSEDAYVYWEIPELQKIALKEQGGKQLTLRIYDATGTELDKGPAYLRQYKCNELAQDIHVSIPTSDRDYVAELGYVTDDNRWLSLARSARVRIPSSTTTSADKTPLRSVETGRTAVTESARERKTGHPTEPTAKPTSARLGDKAEAVSDLVGDGTRKASNLTGDRAKIVGTIAPGAAAAGGAAATARSFLDRNRTDVGSDRTPVSSSHLAQARDCRVILVPRNAKDAYAYWEVTDEYKAALQQQGGRKLMLQIHDATNLDIDYEQPHSTQTYVCDEADRDRHVSIPVSDRDYIAELGYITDDNRWLRLIRSFHVRVPSDSQLL